MTLFEKIVNREIPANIIYEDDDVIAFLDINPVTKGHTLVCPKQAYTCFSQCPSEVLNKVINVSQKLALKIMSKLNAKGINILTNENEIAGQTIFHLHFHIIPRYDESDQINIEFKPNTNINLNEIAEILK